MSVVLASAGAALFLLLGIGHAVFTLQSSPTGGPMMPTNPDVRAAMTVSGGLGLAPDIESNMFKAWIGFNLSHSLGVIAVAAVILVQILDDFATAVSEPWFLVVAFAAPAIYLVLAVKYWFDKPRDGIALGGLLLWVGIILELV